MSFTLKVVKNTRNFKDVPRATALATTAGNLYFLSVTTGSLVAADATTATNQELYLSKQTLASGTTPVNCLVVERGDEFLVDTSANTSATDIGRRVAVNASGTGITNGAADVATGPFEIVALVGVAADKKAIVKRV